MSAVRAGAFDLGVRVWQLGEAAIGSAARWFGQQPNNPLPPNGIGAKVITKAAFDEFVNTPGGTIGKAGAQDIFITAADDLAGIKSAQEAINRLSLAADYAGQDLVVVECPLADCQNLASPVNRGLAEFVGRGLTGGGAREWVVSLFSLKPSYYWYVLPANK